MISKIFEDFEKQINSIKIPDADDTVNESPISYANNPKDAASELEDVYLQLQDGIKQLELIIDTELEPWPNMQQRAKSMVLSHFQTALDSNHNWMGGNMTTLEDIINGLRNADTEGNIQDESVQEDDKKNKGPEVPRNLPAKNMYQKGGAMKDRKKEKKKGMDRKKKHKKPLSQSY